MPVGTPTRTRATAPNAIRVRPVVDFNLLRRVGGRNFRDLGGHPAADGKRVRTRRIYRSAHLADLDAASPLQEVELRTVMTLQSRVEVAVLGPPRPDVLGTARWAHIPIGDAWFEDTASEFISPASNDLHLTLVTEFREHWQAFFALLADPAVYPLLFHCSAGRDRTGVGAALLLELLGVERGRVVADFLASNAEYPELPLRAEQLDPLFDLVDRAGGAPDFVRESLGVTDREIAAIRESLLE